MTPRQGNHTGEVPGAERRGHRGASLWLLHRPLLQASGSPGPAAEMTQPGLWSCPEQPMGQEPGDAGVSEAGAPFGRLGHLGHL